MSVQPKDVYDQVGRIRKDLTDAQGKITALFNMLNALNLQPTPESKCEKCGVQFASHLALAEHDYHSHGGPEPEHWLTIEALSLPDSVPE